MDETDSLIPSAGVGVNDKLICQLQISNGMCQKSVIPGGCLVEVTLKLKPYLT